MSYVTLPNTFSNGTTADASQVNANFNAITAEVNGNIGDANLVGGIAGTKLANGAITDTQLASTYSGYAMYKTLVERSNGESGTATNILSAGTFVLGLQQISGLPAPATQGFYFDPADFAATGRTTKLRLRVSFITNAVAPAQSFVFGLYPVATYGGASGVAPTIATLGAVTSGSTVTFTTPGASNGGSHLNSGDFTAPAAAGYYVVGFTCSGAGAANSYISVRAALQLRQV